MPAQPSPRAKRRARVEPAQIREQILEAFSKHAKSAGIRAVMMGELATELRVSASTLYKHFPSKEGLVLACVERWANELAASEAVEPRSKGGGFDDFMHWVDAWADANAAISPAFVRDLQSDYPAAFRRFREIIDERKRRGAELLRPVLKRELDSRVALAVLDLILNSVVRPEFADRLRISRHDALRSAVSIWAGGAVDRGGQLRVLNRGRRR